jgi:hypothetical protein
MFIFNNFALNMLGYGLEKESFKPFIITFYICIMVGRDKIKQAISRAVSFNRQTFYGWAAAPAPSDCYL